ncbi:unnamed protein product [Urochloa decumbens]|uniref:DUF4220 domain-containing protein n=1 Tax=Urochloa decumbens TaxID=240449 RepID=A0ABC8VP60_9POAL
MGGITQILGTVQARLVRLEVVVLVSAFILTVLVLNRSVHRGFMGVVYSMSYVVVSYAVGLIQDGPFHGEAFVVWAAALLVIQASAMSTSETKALLLIKSAGRCEQECGHAQRKKLLLQHVLQTGLVLWLMVNTRSHNPWYQAAIWALWALSLLKTAAQIVEVTRADRPDPSVKALHEYMTVEEDLIAENSDHQRPDPVTMQGYRFIFHGEETMEPVNHDQDGRPVRGEMLAQSAAKSVVKIDQVYRWIEQQPYSDVEKDRAMDFCLGFALYKLLKRRLYGCDPAEAGSSKARELVLTGFIHAGATGPDASFRIAEAELAFFYEFFYTRNIALQVLGPKTYICVTVAVACLTISSVLFGTLAPTYRPLLREHLTTDGARRQLEGCREESSILAKLQEIEEAEWPNLLQEGGAYERAGSATVIERAAVLWGQLRAAVPADARRWEVLAEFWAEFLLFLAPSDNVDIHGRTLSDGGEFMTQLWVLMANAGVLERPLVMQRQLWGE